MSRINTNSKHKISETVDNVDPPTGRGRGWIIGVAVFLLIGAAAGLILFFVPDPDDQTKSGSAAGSSGSGSGSSGSSSTHGVEDTRKKPGPPTTWPSLGAVAVQYPGSGQGGGSGGPSTTGGDLGVAWTWVAGEGEKIGKWVLGALSTLDKDTQAEQKWVVDTAKLLAKDTVQDAAVLAKDTAPERAAAAKLAKEAESAIVHDTAPARAAAAKWITAEANTVETDATPAAKAAAKWIVGAGVSTAAWWAKFNSPAERRARAESVLNGFEWTAALTHTGILFGQPGDGAQKRGVATAAENAALAKSKNAIIAAAAASAAFAKKRWAAAKAKALALFKQHSAAVVSDEAKATAAVDATYTTVASSVAFAAANAFAADVSGEVSTIGKGLTAAEADGPNAFFAEAAKALAIKIAAKAKAEVTKLEWEAAHWGQTYPG